MRTSLVDLLCRVPMAVWKRLALYPILWHVLLTAFLPCRVTAAGTVEMLGLSAVGLAGVIAHFAE